jgi:AcrR family transcriptional regulator
VATEERSGHATVRQERRRRADAQRNRERLLVAAREAFTAYGLDATMDDIARRAGVGPGTLYRHFPNLETLLAAVYREDVEALARRADELAGEYPPDEALAAFLRLQLEYVKTKLGLGAAVKKMLGADSDTLAFCRETLRDAAGRLLGPAKAVGALRPEVQPADVMRLVHGVGMASESAPQDADRLLSYVLDGLRPRADTTGR